MEMPIRFVVTVVFCALGFLSPFHAKAANEDLALFLKSSAYGAAFGAGAGLTSLAFSDQPSKNLNQVARGASLGLYVGMAVGFYLVNQRSESINSNASKIPFWILPQTQGLAVGLSFEMR